MNPSLVSFCLVFLFGVTLSLLGGLIIKIFAKKASIGGVQMAFLCRFMIDVAAFSLIYQVYHSLPSLVGLALGLMSYKNVLVFRVIKESWQEERKE
jgi:hypothetical protein